MKRDTCQKLARVPRVLLIMIGDWAAARRRSALIWVLGAAAAALFRQSLLRALDEMQTAKLRKQFAERTQFYSARPPALEVLGWLAAGVAVGVLAFRLGEHQRNEKQRQRNLAANALADQVAEERYSLLKRGEIVGDFVLYLRPFTLDDAMHDASPPIGWPLLPSFWTGSPRQLLFEEHLATMLRRTGHSVISIGHSSANLGPGRIETSDTDWFERFTSLARAATAIALVPGAGDGVVEEMRYLRSSGLIWKTVVFKPRGYARQRWEEAAERLAQERFDLPDWSRWMLSFRLSSSGQVIGVRTWYPAILLPGALSSVDQLFGSK